MKSLLLAFLSVFAFTGVQAQCFYTLTLLDSWGDGWNGNTIDLYVNGVTTSHGSLFITGSAFVIPVTINSGDSVAVIWQGGGSLASECSYELADNNGGVVFTSGSGSSMTVGVVDYGTSAACITGPNPCLVSTFPFTEDFEGWAGTVPSCWTGIKTSTSGFGWTWDQNGTGSSNTGPSSGNSGDWYVYLETSGAYGTFSSMELPSFDLTSVTNPQLRFYYHMYGANMGTMSVEVSTDNKVTWTTVWSKSGAEQTDELDPYTLDSVNLVGYGSSETWIRFVGGGHTSFASDMAVDDIYVGDGPLCPGSGGVAISNVTRNTATVSWTSIVPDHKVEYGPTGFTQGTGTQVSPATSPVTLTGLQGSTTYDVYIQDSCSATSVVWVGPYSFTTLQSIMALPYYEGFESGTGDWLISGTNSTWEHGTPTGTVISGASQGSNAWVTNLDGVYNNSDNSTLTTPYFDNSSGTFDVVYEFDMALATENNYDETWVEYSFNDTLWTKLTAGAISENWYNDLGNQWWEGDSDPSWTKRLAVIPNSAGEVVHIRHQFSSDGSARREGIGLDEVNAYEIPCEFPVQDLVVSNVTASSFDVSWTSNASSWEIESGPIGFGQATGVGTITPYTSDSVTISINACDSMDIYVRTTCGATNGDWVGPIIVGTLCEYDVKMNHLYVDVNTCGDSATAVYAVVENKGMFDAIGFPVYTDVSGGLTATLSATYTDTLSVGESDSIMVGTFNSYNGAVGVNITGYSDLSTDQFNGNDSITIRGVGYIGPAPLVAANDTICSTDAFGVLYAEPIAGLRYGWYVSPTDTVPAHIGDSLIVNNPGQLTWYLGYEDPLGTIDNGIPTFGNSGDGHTFGVLPNQYLSIDGFDFNFVTAAGTSVDVVISYIQDTVDVANTLDPSLWTVNDTVSVISAGLGQPTFVGLTNNLNFNAGTMYGIRVEEIGGDIYAYQSFGTPPEVYATYPEADLYWGYEYYPGTTTQFYSRFPHGKIHFDVGSACSDSMVPVSVEYYSDTVTDVIVACDSYTWIDGNTYTASNNTATYTWTNAAGCNVFSILDLTINSSSTGAVVFTACDSVVFQGTTFLQDTTIYVNYLKENNCDSLVTYTILIGTQETYNTGLSVNGLSSDSTYFASSVSSSISIGTSPNAYGVGYGARQNLSANQDLNTIVFVHRSDYGSNNDNSSGSLRYDISTDGGSTWSTNQGPLWNPNVSGYAYPGVARYPQMGILNSPGNTTPNNASLAVWAPTLAGTNANVWGGALHGNVGIGTSVNNLTVDTTAGHLTLDNSFTQDGNFWGISLDHPNYDVDEYTDTAYVFKGVMDWSADSMIYSKSKAYMPSTNDPTNGKTYGDANIIFDDLGSTGYISLMTYNGTIAPDKVIHPILSKSINGGQSWAPVFGPNLDNLIDNVSGDSLKDVFVDITGWTIGHLTSSTRGHDLALDADGRPHMIMHVFPGKGTNTGSGTAGDFVFYPAVNLIVDVYLDNGLWKCNVLKQAYTFEFDYDQTNGPVTEANRPQVSMSPDREWLFFSWFESDTSFANSTENQYPDWYVSVYDVNGDSLFNPYTKLAGFGDRHFANVSEWAFDNGDNTYELHSVYSDIDDWGTFSILSPIDHYYQRATLTIVANQDMPDTLFLCQGDTVELGAKETNAASYLWSTGETSNEISVSTSGLYWVDLSDNSSCSTLSDSVYVEIISNPLDSITSNSSFPICRQDSMMLSAPLGDSYLWSTGDTAQFIEIDSSGTYSVTVTNGDYCSTLSQPFTAVINEYPDAQLTAGSQYLCDTDTLQVSVPSGYTYSWSTSDTTAGISISSAGDYWVTVVDSNLCTSTSDTISIGINTLPNDSIVVSGTLDFCDGDFVEFTAYDATANYAWSNGDTTGTILVDQTGQYSLTLTSDSGCVSVSSLLSTIAYSLPDSAISILGSLDICPDDSVTLFAPTGPYSYSWSNGDSSSSIVVTQGGQFTLNVIDGNGCVNTSDTIVVVEVPVPQVSSIIGDTVGIVPLQQYIYVISQVVGQTYSWTVTNGAIVSGQGTNIVSVLWNQTNTGTLSVTTSNGYCEDSTKVSIRTNIGVDDFSLTDFSLYPNPTQGKLVIETDFNTDEILIYNAQGRLIQVISTTGERHQLDISNYSAGVYWIEIQNVRKRVVLID